MAELTVGMTHGQAIAHLENDVLATSWETELLVTKHTPAYFSAVRAIMCDIDYVAALYFGWDGADPRRIATSRKAARFIREVMGPAADERSERWGQHLYELYRHGLVHLHAPKLLAADGNSTDKLTWALMYARRETLRKP